MIVYRITTMKHYNRLKKMSNVYNFKYKNYYTISILTDGIERMIYYGLVILLPIYLSSYGLSPAEYVVSVNKITMTYFLSMSVLSLIMQSFNALKITKIFTAISLLFNIMILLKILSNQRVGLVMFAVSMIPLSILKPANLKVFVKDLRTNYSDKYHYYCNLVYVVNNIFIITGIFITSFLASKGLFAAVMIVYIVSLLIAFIQMIFFENNSYKLELEACSKGKLNNKSIKQILMFILLSFLMSGFYGLVQHSFSIWVLQSENMANSIIKIPFSSAQASLMNPIFIIATSPILFFVTKKFRMKPSKRLLFFLSFALLSLLIITGYEYILTQKFMQIDVIWQILPYIILCISELFVFSSYFVLLTSISPSSIVSIAIASSYLSNTFAAIIGNIVLRFSGSSFLYFYIIYFCFYVACLVALKFIINNVLPKIFSDTSESI